MENKSSITARMSAFARAYHAETEARPVFRDTLAKDLMTPEEYDAVRGYLLSGAAFFVIRYLPARRRFLPPRPRAGYLRQS